jgi:hypothetical protein
METLDDTKLRKNAFHRALSAPGDRQGVVNERVAPGRPSQPPGPRVMR